MRNPVRMRFQNKILKQMTERVFVEFSDRFTHEGQFLKPIVQSVLSVFRIRNPKIRNTRIENGKDSVQ
jgi:hypothetical protein